MKLEDIRNQIDAIDLDLRALLMRRLDCSYMVAESKQESGSTDIYRADRELMILKRLGTDIPEDRKAGYLSVVRKIMETSRMYQYGLLYDSNPALFSMVDGSSLLQGPTQLVIIRMTRPDQPNAMSSILSMIGDYGYNMDRMELLNSDADACKVTFELTLRGDLTDEHMKKLMFQLSKESEDFKIMSVN